MQLPEDLFEHLIHSYCPYDVRRLDGAIQYARPDDEDWSSHEERQETTREARARPHCDASRVDARRPGRLLGIGERCGDGRVAGKTGARVVVVVVARARRRAW